MSRQISALDAWAPFLRLLFIPLSCFFHSPSARTEGRRRHRLLSLFPAPSSSPVREGGEQLESHHHPLGSHLLPPRYPLLFPTDFDFLSAFLFLVIRAKRLARHFFPYLSTRRSFLHPPPFNPPPPRSTFAARQYLLSSFGLLRGGGDCESRVAAIGSSTRHQTSEVLLSNRR